MKKNVLYTLFFFVLHLGLFKSQVITKTDTLQGTSLTISMDKRVSETMSKMEDNCTRPTQMPNSDSDVDVRDSRGSGSSSRPLSRAEICRQNPRILGYKIQIAVAKSNQEANEIKSFFRNRFPNIKVETDASLRPNYRILVGSYVSKQSASSDLSRIRSQFKSARAVQYRVFCVEAK